ncbi:MAG: tRNA dihydrouridine synthase DusB [Desulfobacterales bacterium]
MQIGPLTLENPVILAPLAGITNLPFRILAREAGCALVFSEMVSADGLVYGSQNTFELLRSLPAEKPLAVQIFGSDPARMAEAAAAVEASGADVLDINFGCAVKKVLKTGSGAALMRAPKRAETILTAVRRAVRIPLTVKLRSGWESSAAQAFELGAIAEGCGVDAVTIHPRTAVQKFSGRADWRVIAALKARLRIPVIGNGDVACADDAARMMAETGCDAVMVGRRAIGYPRIFTEIASRLRNAPAPPEAAGERAAVMRRFLEMSLTCYGPQNACALMRHRLGWFTKGVRGGAALRCAAAGITSLDQARELIEGFDRAARLQ